MKATFSLLALLCLATVSAKDKTTSSPVPVDDRVLVLDPLHVQGKPVVSFGFDLRVYSDPQTKKVTHVLITRVIPRTDAEKAGLRPGDEIVKVDGVAMQDLEAEVSVHSEFGRIFLNRKPGDQAKLEVITRRTENFTLHIQHQMPDLSD